MFLFGGHGLAQCINVVGPTVPLYWDANSEPDIDHYNVYRSSTSGFRFFCDGAHFMNGNNTVFYSRVYLWNPSAVAGDITVRVFTLPIKGSTPKELTATPFNLGTLGAESGRNIRLAEDILAVMGIRLPYTADGGNLILEFTIGAPDVRGAGQVFSLDLAFGTYTLQ
jgi:hypothetical protein